MEFMRMVETISAAGPRGDGKSGPLVPTKE